MFVAPMKTNYTDESMKPTLVALIVAGSNSTLNRERLRLAAHCGRRRRWRHTRRASPAANAHGKAFREQECEERNAFPLLALRRILLGPDAEVRRKR
jgi:hypothetical protein